MNGCNKATNGSDYCLSRGSADRERRLAALLPIAYCLLLDSFDVFAGSGVDFNLFALFDKVRDDDVSAGFELGGFGNVGSGVAFNAGLAVDNNEVYKVLSFCLT